MFSHINKSDIFLRRAFLLLFDFLFMLLAFWLVNFTLRGIPGGVKALSMPITLLLTFVNIVVYWLGGLYNTLWEYTGTREILQIGFTTVVAAGVDLAIGLLLQNRLRYIQYIFVWLTLFLFALGLRLSYRFLRYLRDWFSVKSRRSHRRILVIGADDKGSSLISRLQSGNMSFGTPVVILDDNRLKWNKRVHGVKVYGGLDKLSKTIRVYSIDEVIIADANLTGEKIRQVHSITRKLGCEMRLSHEEQRYSPAASGQHFSLREIDIHDLIGRKRLVLDTNEIRPYLEHKVILVTGAGGSIGSEIVRQVSLFDPDRVILFDEYENNVFTLSQDLAEVFDDKITFVVEIGSVQDADRIDQLCRTYQPEVIFHAAAHKHVPLMEHNPGEAVKNNILGTANLAAAADRYGCAIFVMISTDKAVNPTSVMGATKALAERIVRSYTGHSKTCFTCVRFGNVLGSAGSALPIFQKQIEAGGPVTLTDQKMVRYFMTIPEAAGLVIRAGAMAKGGETYILRMGDPVRILDLAINMIRLSGLEPFKDIDIVETGIRPGEKMYEELQQDDEVVLHTEDPDIFVCRQTAAEKVKIAEMLTELRLAASGDPAEVKQALARNLDSYKPEER